MYIGQDKFGAGACSESFEVLANRVPMDWTGTAYGAVAHKSAFRAEVVDMHNDVLGCWLELVVWNGLHPERHRRIPTDAV